MKDHVWTPDVRFALGTGAPPSVAESGRPAGPGDADLGQEASALIVV